MNLVSWDDIESRVDGARVNEFVRDMHVADEIKLVFRPGNIHVSGYKKVAILPVPFAANVTSIQVQGRTIVVPVSILPIAAPIVRSIVASKLPDGVTIRPPFTFVIRLDRFLPPFVDLEIREIRIIEGGLAVSIGPGGASWS